MIKIIEAGGKTELPGLRGRGEQDASGIEAVVADIIATVKEKGDDALLAYCKKFDNAELTSLEVSQNEIDEATSRVKPEFIAILEKAAKNIRVFHEKQKRTGFVMDEKPGVIMGQRIIPLERVGIYVPGGTAPYPSTVLMDAIPAKIAGVSEIIMTTPATGGKIADNILAAAKVAGVDRIFKLGGAQAVAALSCGTKSVPRVDKIVGPGNAYVATAKRMVYGLVDIDMIAGPSDILVIADDTANPRHVAADLLSQAEHDKLATATLVTTSAKLAKEVQSEIEKQLESLPRHDIARYSIVNNGAIVITDTLENAVKISNYVAPEHLEICTDSPFGLLSQVKHAGSVFLGKHAPEPLGDYFAGPNHTLPTNGTARFSSPLSVDDFVKRSSFIYYEKEALEREYADIAAFARHEGLEAHARSAEIRFTK